MMKLIESLAPFSSLISSLLSSLTTWLILRWRYNRKRKASLESTYNEILQKYIDLSSKYVEIIDMYTQIQVENLKLKNTMELLESEIELLKRGL